MVTVIKNKVNPHLAFGFLPVHLKPQQNTVDHSLLHIIINYTAQEFWPPDSEDVFNPMSGNIHVIPDIRNFRRLRQNNILQGNIRQEFLA
jgi:hypothetical protein